MTLGQLIRQLIHFKLSPSKIGELLGLTEQELWELAENNQGPPKLISRLGIENPEQDILNKEISPKAAQELLGTTKTGAIAGAVIGATLGFPLVPFASAIFGVAGYKLLSDHKRLLEKLNAWSPGSYKANAMAAASDLQPLKKEITALPSSEMSKTSFQLVYDGPALSSHEMAAKDLGTALISMSEVIQEADKAVNQGKTESRLSVHASFKTGCFKIDFSSSQHIAQAIKDLFTGDTATAVLNAAGIVGLVFAGSKSLWALLKWLKGRKPDRLEALEGSVRVHLSDKYIEVEKATIELYRNHMLRQSLKEAFAPLERDGVDSIAIVQDGEVLATATKAEKDYFGVIPYEERELDDQMRIAILNIVAPSFAKGLKWRVNDGGANFTVSMEDEGFLEQVTRGDIQFSATTLLKVELREVQWTDDKGVIHKDSTIQKVLEVVPVADGIKYENTDFLDRLDGS